MAMEKCTLLGRIWTLESVWTSGELHARDAWISLAEILEGE